MVAPRGKQTSPAPSAWKRILLCLGVKRMRGLPRRGPPADPREGHRQAEDPAAREISGAKTTRSASEGLSSWSALEMGGRDWAVEPSGSVKK